MHCLFQKALNAPLDLTYMGCCLFVYSRLLFLLQEGNEMLQEMVGSCPALGGSADCRGTSRQRRIYPDGVSTSCQIPSQGIDLSDFISYRFTRGDFCVASYDANNYGNSHRIERFWFDYCHRTIHYSSSAPEPNIRDV